MGVSLVGKRCIIRHRIDSRVTQVCLGTGEWLLPSPPTARPAPLLARRLSPTSPPRRDHSSVHFSIIPLSSLDRPAHTALFRDSTTANKKSRSQKEQKQPYHGPFPLAFCKKPRRVCVCVRERERERREADIVGGGYSACHRSSLHSSPTQLPLFHLELQQTAPSPSSSDRRPLLTFHFSLPPKKSIEERKIRKGKTKGKRENMSAPYYTPQRPYFPSPQQSSSSSSTAPRPGASAPPSFTPAMRDRQARGKDPYSPHDSPSDSDLEFDAVDSPSRAGVGRLGHLGGSGQGRGQPHGGAMAGAAGGGGGSGVVTAGGGGVGDGDSHEVRRRKLWAVAVLEDPEKLAMYACSRGDVSISLFGLSSTSFPFFQINRAEPLADDGIEHSRHPSPLHPHALRLRRGDPPAARPPQGLGLFAAGPAP